MFFHAQPLSKPEDVRQHLAKPDRHWRKGYSAMELATSWIEAGGFPGPVQAVLGRCPAYAGAELIEGLFEHQVDLGTRGRPSQTDLMVLAHVKVGYAVIAVEGKVEENFGPLISEWNDGSAGKLTRLNGLCASLALDPAAVGGLRYQLLHRCVSALLEAQRYRAHQAMMLVHSFSRTDASLDDFTEFGAAMRIDGVAKDRVSDAKRIGSQELRLAWVADRPS